MEAIIDFVRNYLLDNYGNMTLPGRPVRDESQDVWRIPIICRTERGLLVAGEVKVDDDLNVLRATPKEKALRAIEAQLERLPYLVYATREELEAAGFKPVIL